MTIANNFDDDDKLPGGIRPISANAFTDSFLVDPKPAVDLGGGQTTTPSPAVSPEMSVHPDDPEEKPIVPDTAREEKDDQEIKIKKWTPAEREELEANLEMMLNSRSIGQGMIGSWISGEDASKYELSEENMQRLAKVYAPYMRKYGNKIPDWFWLILAESLVMTPLIRTVAADRAVNRANQKLANSESVQQAVRAAAAAPAGNRKNYSIDENGYYMKDAKSNMYLSKAKRTTKASFEDIKRILEDNEYEVVKSVFPQLDNAA